MGIRALQRFSTMSRLPRNIRNAPKGGFEPRMSRYEAAKIVGVRYSRVFGARTDGASERFVSRAKLAERYKKTMLANHPDRGGSPYLALKINEAKRVLTPFAK